MNPKDRRLPALPLPVPRTNVDPALVLATARDLQTVLSPFGPLALTIKENDDDTLLVLTEDERTTEISLRQITSVLGRDGVLNIADSVRTGLLNWIDTRPVTNADAARKGLAVAGWTAKKTRICWRLVVPRPTGISNPWVPTFDAAATHVRTIRKDAFKRSEQVTVTPLRSGDVTVWAYPPNPYLSSTALTRPDMLAAGNPLEDMRAVVTPGRAVAVAPEVAATRLIEELHDPYAVLALADLHTIRWA